MSEFSVETIEAARPIFKAYEEELSPDHYFPADEFQAEFRKSHKLYDLEVIDFAEHLIEDPEFEHVAVAFLEAIIPTGPPEEVKHTLAQAYGAYDYHHDDDLDKLRDKYWDRYWKSKAMEK
ncbi:hypothetical protein [Rubinisphaera italica]|uniref:Uncharacterized protein n=1 Tax=Rubinisphaera italica TaxID=2527969 RepID=A0A5C5XJY3_9PLAN|nr:hypothetical protein [Rubinisphaera italica]TWT63154.1 hypothetical protein Pan54_39070 [Rubinisphaera italica]